MATPQPSKKLSDHISESLLQSSAPLPKRKKLAEEIAEALSDAEFEAGLEQLRLIEKERYKFMPISGEMDSLVDTEDEVSDFDFTSSDQFGGSWEASSPRSTSQSDDNMSLDTTDLTSSAADGTPDSNVSAVVAMPRRWGLCNVCHCVTRVTTKGKIFKHGPGCTGSMQAPVDGSISEIKTKCAELKIQMATAAVANRYSDDAGLAVDAKVKEERDGRTVFIKNLSKKVTESDLRKKLRLDILEIRLKKTKSKKYRGKKCAFIRFGSADYLKKNKSTIDRRCGIYFRHSKVDFVGRKSVESSKSRQDPRVLPDFQRLYISGFNRDRLNVEVVKEMFPTATEVKVPVDARHKFRPCGFAFVQFADVASAKVAHDTMQGKSHEGRLLSVMYAKTPAKKVLQQQQQQKTGTAGATSASSDVGAGSSGCEDSRSGNENSGDEAKTSHDDDDDDDDGGRDDDYGEDDDDNDDDDDAD